MKPGQRLSVGTGTSVQCSPRAREPKRKSVQGAVEPQSVRRCAKSSQNND